MLKWMCFHRFCRSFGPISVALWLLAATPCAWALRGGELELRVVDDKTDAPLACRVHLKNQARKAQKPGKVPFWHDHFALDGSLLLKLPHGSYVFEIERGPEYAVLTGHFTINENAKDSKTVRLKRFVNMAAEGWWSGDLEVARPAKEIELVMLADDLHLAEGINTGAAKSASFKTAPVKNAKPPGSVVNFDSYRAYRLSADLQQSAGGSLLLLNLDEPLADEQHSSDDLVELVRKTRERRGWMDVRRAASWDLPIWVALGLVDSIELADSELARHSAKADEAGTRPRDRLRFAGADGVGRWPEAIYHHLLNCGLRIVPTAGSGSGLAPNPVGYNRVYVHLGTEFSYEKWFEGLRAGRSMVTNGPLIRPTVEGEMPGHVFQGDPGEELELEVGLTLSTRDPISYLEVIQSGRTVQEVRLDALVKAGGKMPPLRFKESGWFLMRAVTEVSDTHRFASTAPYYVEIGYQRRISRTSVQFFLDWLDERAKLVGTEPMDSPAAQARAYWQDLLEKANAE